jgi:ferredoxin
MMEVRVDQDLCISCGLCVSNCPDIFVWNKEEKAEAVKEKVEDDLEDCVQDAADGCPTDAIETM